MPSSPREQDPNTDPGRPHPYESLYRSAPGDPALPSRPTPRHFEQHLSRPDGAQEGFGWLYRTDPEPGPAAGTPRTADAPPAPMPPGRSTAPVPPARRGVRRGIVIALVVALICAVAGVAGGILLTQRRDTSSDGPSGNTTASSASATDLPLTKVSPANANVSCQAPPATDDARQPVSYGPSLMYDGTPETAWRCDGTGVGETVIFTFPADTTISELGLVNGYAKVDPASGAHRYGEYRRITKVTWTFPNGVTVPQTLTDGNESTQSVTVPDQQATQVVMTIDATTAPGSTSATRDAVLVSEVAFAG